MAIVPNDPRQPDYTASDILSTHALAAPNLEPGRRPRRHLHQDRRRFPSDDPGETPTSGSGEPGDAAGGDARRHRLSISLGSRDHGFTDVAAARGLFATGNPEHCAAEPRRLPWFRSRLAPLRVSELRDTARRAAIRPPMRRCGAELGIGSVLMIPYFIEGRPAGHSVSPARGRAAAWTSICSCSSSSSARASRPDSSASRSRARSNVSRSAPNWPLPRQRRPVGLR